MLKKAITYKDYNNVERTDIFYFNLTKAELIEFELKQEGGMGAYLTRIAESNDNKEIIETFKEIILLAIGEKSEDGRYFRKNDTIRENFAASEAYSELFIELATDAKKAAEFITGVVPAELIEGIPNLPDSEEPKLIRNPAIEKVELPPSLDISKMSTEELQALTEELAKRNRA